MPVVRHAQSAPLSWLYWLHLSSFFKGLAVDVVAFAPLCLGLVLAIHPVVLAPLAFDMAPEILRFNVPFSLSLLLTLLFFIIFLMVERFLVVRGFLLSMVAGLAAAAAALVAELAVLGLLDAGYVQLQDVALNWAIIGLLVPLARRFMLLVLWGVSAPATPIISLSESNDTGDVMLASVPARVFARQGRLVAGEDLCLSGASRLLRSSLVVLTPSLKGSDIDEKTKALTHSVTVGMPRSRGQWWALQWRILARLLKAGVKRAIDVVGAALGLVVLAPLFAVLAWRISRDGGQPFFGHPRIGRYGKVFLCYKFRTMVVNAKEVLEQHLAVDPVARAEWQANFKLKNDPRVTPLGKFLRRTSLDELPQLWNILKGEMSLVGPRPIVAAELERYGRDADYYLALRPGLTGLWQVSGRSDIDYDQRVALDRFYATTTSLIQDMKILGATAGVVLRRDGAY
ncbi:MAG: sugar transferase [Holosporales bacterium]|jgi:lipopolysaccharide/colanic/teichoic acid biosynthesis glycosyltransferase